MLSIFPCFSMEKNRRNVFLLLVLQHSHLQRPPVHQIWEQSWCHGTRYHCSFLLDCSSSWPYSLQGETEEADIYMKNIKFSYVWNIDFCVMVAGLYRWNCQYFGYIKEKQSNNYGSFLRLKYFMDTLEAQKEYNKLSCNVVWREYIKK